MTRHVHAVSALLCAVALVACCASTDAADGAADVTSPTVTVSPSATNTPEPSETDSPTPTETASPTETETASAWTPHPTAAQTRVIVDGQEREPGYVCTEPSPMGDGHLTLSTNTRDGIGLMMDMHPQAHVVMRSRNIDLDMEYSHTNQWEETTTAEGWASFDFTLADGMHVIWDVAPLEQLTACGDL